VTQAYYIGLGHPINSTCVQHPPSIIKDYDITFYCNGLNRDTVIFGYYPDFNTGRLTNSNSIRNLWPEGIPNPDNINLNHIVENAIEINHVFILVQSFDIGG
jgi:hypothetical protein